MKSLSLWQPWASLIGRGKTIETRSWDTQHRGLLAIHAAKRWTREEDAQLKSHTFQGALMPDFPGLWCEDRPLPLGAIIAVVNQVACVPTALCRVVDWLESSYQIEWALGRMVRVTLSEQERGFGDYTQFRYAHLYTDIVILPEPIPYAGRQGLFDLDMDLSARLEMVWVTREEAA